MNSWILAVYLQILDFLTTVLFVSQGLSEFNPIIVFFIRNFGIWGSIVTKLIIIIGILAIYLVHKSGKTKINFKRLLSRVNYFYAFVVVWNLICLTVAILSAN